MILAIRRKRIITMCLIVCTALIGSAVCLHFKGNAILRGLQCFIEDKISQALEAEVAMDSVRTNFIGPAVLNGLRMTKATAQDTPFILKTDRVIIYNNTLKIIWEKLFGRKPLVEKPFVFNFKIENGFLYKGEKVIFKNISGKGKIINDNLIFTDINGKIYDFPLSVYGKFSTDTSKIDLKIKSESEHLKATARLSNDILRPHAAGRFEFNDSRKIYFSGDLDIKPGESVSMNNFIFQDTILVSGKIDFLKKAFCAELKKKSVSGSEALSEKNIIGMVADFSKQDFLKASIFLKHVNIGDFDIQNQWDIELARALEAKNKHLLRGRIKTIGTILNYKPFNELDGEFCIQDNILRISSLKLGKGHYKLSGFVSFCRPYELDLALDVKNGNLSQLFLASESDSEANISAKVNGRIKVKGPIGDLTTSARLECGKGRLGEINYESMNINLKGRGSVLEVCDSRILREQGYIDLAGEVDLKHFWSQSPYKGLNWTCGNEAIIWKGWDISKQTDSRQLEMKKAIGRQKEFAVTFKSYLNDEQLWQGPQVVGQNEALGVEYNLDDAKKVKMQLKNNEEIFSFENKVRF